MSLTTPYEFDKAMMEDARTKQEQTKKDLYNLKIQEFHEKLAREERAYKKQFSELIDKYSLKDEQGKIIGDPWDNSDKHAAGALRQGTDATNAEWKNAMLALLGSFAKLAEAMHCSLEAEVKKPGRDLVSTFFSRPPSPPDLKILGKIALPILMHNVTLNDTNGLVVQLAKDNIPMKEEFNKLFTGLVEHWLGEHGYKSGTTPETENQFFTEDGTKLTQTKMKELQNDSRTSLQSFLEENSSLTYESSPRLG
jgi:hypothetical protein